jgi:vWA-MoxR associated protein C-terminal domain/vWA-MoxR associated protein middle region 0
VPHSPAIHHTIVAVDIADFTNPTRTEVHHAAMRNGLYDVLRTAFDEAGVRWESCDHEDRGDGVLILVPSQFSKTLIVDQLPARLVSGLTRYNAVHTAEASIQLRMAVHYGEVQDDDGGKVGIAVNNTFRILEAEPAKADLRKSQGVLAMIASDPLYREVIATDPGTRPDSFRQIAVAVKHTRGVAWLRILGKISVADQSRVLDVFPGSALDQLRETLGDVTVPQLAILLARATGPGVPQPNGEPNAWQAVEYLLDFNAGPDGLPPVTIFLELLAGQVGGWLRVSLTQWNDAQARYLRLGPALDRLRAADRPPIDLDLCLHLMILIEHDGLDPDRYLVSHWRQDDPLEWPPARGETRNVAFGELEWAVDDLVVSAEAAWSGHQGEAALEFVLPRALLNLPVDHWYRERLSGDPRPLALDYPIVIRSLERMMSQHWHRVWRNKWSMLTEDPTAARVHVVTDAEAGQPYRIDRVLKDPHVVSIVLNRAPRPEGRSHDELGAALRAGLPVVLWTREEDGKEFVTRLAESDVLNDLPQRVLMARQDAVAGSDDERMGSKAVRGLVILWDDPRRLVYLDQPLRPT